MLHLLKTWNQCIKNTCYRIINNIVNVLKTTTIWLFKNKLKRCLKKECWKQRRYVKFKGTMTKTNTQHDTKHVEHHDATDVQNKTIIFLNFLLYISPNVYWLWILITFYFLTVLHCVDAIHVCYLFDFIIIIVIFYY